MATPQSAEPVPTTTPFADQSSRSGVSYPWLKWFQATLNTINGLLNNAATKAEIKTLQDRVATLESKLP